LSAYNQTFKALSDPTRRKILQILKEKPLTAGEIAEHFNMTKPSISHHLSLLKQADMIIDEKRGQYIVYELNTTVFQDITKWFLALSENEEKAKKGE